MRTPFDFMLGYKRDVLFCDLKTTDKEFLFHDTIIPHQVQSLYDLSRHARAGYIVEFRRVHEIYFFDAKDLVEMTFRSSLAKEMGLFIGKSAPMFSLNTGRLFNFRSDVPQTD